MLKIGLFGALLALGACAQMVAQKEDMLAEAGFSARPASTPQTAALLRAMPPHKFTQQMRNGQPVWVYADPTICGCLYIGNDAAFQNYKQLVAQKQTIQQEQLVNQDATLHGDMPIMDGAWGN